MNDLFVSLVIGAFCRRPAEVERRARARAGIPPRCAAVAFDLVADGETDPCRRFSRLCSRWTPRDAARILRGSMPMPLSLTEKAQRVAPRAPPNADHGRPSGPGVEWRCRSTFLEELDQPGLVGADHGRGLRGIMAGRVSTEPEVGQSLSSAFSLGGMRSAGCPAPTRERSASPQSGAACDRCPVDGERNDIRRRLGVELALVAAGEELRCSSPPSPEAPAGRARRYRQIVRAPRSND